jgi:hypothetical protein
MKSQRRISNHLQVEQEPENLFRFRPLVPFYSEPFQHLQLEGHTLYTVLVPLSIVRSGDVQPRVSKIRAG